MLPILPYPFLVYKMENRFFLGANCQRAEGACFHKNAIHTRIDGGIEAKYRFSYRKPIIYSDNLILLSLISYYLKISFKKLFTKPFICSIIITNQTVQRRSQVPVGHPFSLTGEGRGFAFGRPWDCHGRCR